MGMYDSVYVSREDTEPLRCAAGHALYEEFQTKGLGHELATYFLYGTPPALYESHRKSSKASIVRVAPTRFVWRVDKPLEKMDLTDYLNIYCECRECRPVMTRSIWGERGTYPSCEFRLHFVDGVVREIVPVELQTRDGIIKDILANGGKIVRDAEDD